MLREWYGSEAVCNHWNPGHIKFVLNNLEEIKLGIWPPNLGKETSGYYDIIVEPLKEITAKDLEKHPEWILPKNTKKSPQIYKAHGEYIISIGAICEMRLDECGKDGDYYRTWVLRLDESIDDLADIKRCSIQEAKELIRRVHRHFKKDRLYSKKRWDGIDFTKGRG